MPRLLNNALLNLSEVPLLTVTGTSALYLDAGGQALIRLTSAGADPGLILLAGNYAGQQVVLRNEGAVNLSLQGGFYLSGPSTGQLLYAFTERRFGWSPGLALWLAAGISSVFGDSTT